VRIDHLAADALIGCDIVVSSSAKASASYRQGMQAVMNMAEMPTGDIVRIRDASLNTDQRLAAIQQAIGQSDFPSVDANKLAETLLGDTVFANIIMLGLAWQAGLVPVSYAAMLRAIELNGVAVEKNIKAFACGRLAFAEPERINALLTPAVQVAEPLHKMIERRVAFLTDYQDAAYAEQYAQQVERVHVAEQAFDSEKLTTAVARSLFKLMAYKDEYEVARLHTDSAFKQQINEQFSGDFTLKYHLAPPLISFKKDGRGRPMKREFGAWMTPAFKQLAKMKKLRGSKLDIFSYTAERKMERGLIDWYLSVIDRSLAQLNADNHAEMEKLLVMPMDIRGYGSVKHEAVEKVQAQVHAVLPA